MRSSCCYSITPRAGKSFFPNLIACGNMDLKISPNQFPI